MEIKTYNKKAFLLPDSINSMAAFHAKLFEDGKYIFRIHDCLTGVRLTGQLYEEKDFIEAEQKLIALSNACVAFSVHIAELRKQNFDKNNFEIGLHDYSTRL